MSNKRKVVVGDRSWPSLAAFQKDIGIASSSLHLRLSRGETFADLINDPHPPLKGTKIVFQGKSYASIRLLARGFGLLGTTVSQRLYAGWSMNRAMLTPQRGSKGHVLYGFCIACDEQKSLDKFYSLNRSRCKKCVQLKDKIKMYGPEVVDFLEDHDGTCACCGTDKPGMQNWATDHCHKTGRVRGIVCNPCNLGMGNFEDSIDKLQMAIEYLKRT